MDYLNDLDKKKKPIKKHARRIVNSTRAWKQTHYRMEEARLPAENYEKFNKNEKGNWLTKTS